MRSERMPWTCRWSEYRPADKPSLWLDDWMREWVCLAERRKRGRATSLDRCVACGTWEPRDEAWHPRSE